MASLKDIKVNINVDTTDFIKSLRQLQERIKMDNVRILKGWTKEEQKELEEAKEDLTVSGLIQIITRPSRDGKLTHIEEKYDKSDDKYQTLIIEDILDFYTDKAEFPEPKKYYIQLIKNNDGSYINRNKLNTFLTLDGCRSTQNYQTEFTEQEIKDIDPRYMAFAVPVEAK